MPNETMINKRANGINWNTTVFMVLFISELWPHSFYLAGEEWRPQSYSGG